MFDLKRRLFYCVFGKIKIKKIKEKDVVFDEPT